MGTLSTTSESYVKAIWHAREWTDEAVTTGALAVKLGLSPSSVSEAVRKLTAAGLVSHARYGAIELTDEGLEAALGVVRKHRLIETFLVNYLGYGWDEVHDEAENLEHAVSGLFIDRLDHALGEPSRDPHGDPIPRSDGSIPPLPAIPLTEAPEGETVRIGQVSDRDSDLLRHLEVLGIGLDAQVIVRETSSSAGTLSMEHDGKVHQFGFAAASAIRVIPI